MAAGGWGTDIYKTRGFWGHLLFLEVFETEGRREKETHFGGSSRTGQEVDMESHLAPEAFGCGECFLESLCLIRTHPVCFSPEDTVSGDHAVV